MEPFYTHKYTQLFEENATELDAVYTDILDNASPNSKFNIKGLGDIAVFDIPIESEAIQFHHNGSSCYLIRALAIWVVPDAETNMEALLAKKPDFLVVRASLWSDEDSIRDVTYINDELPNCAHIKAVENRLIKETLTQIPHHGQSATADGYIDEDFPISALLHVQRSLGCNPKAKIE